MKTYQIVLDTNVLLAGLRSQRGASYKLLTLLKDKRWQLNLSNSLIFEYEEILKREQAQLNLTVEEIDRLLNGLCSIARQHSIFYLWRPITHDPDDDFLIDLALEAQADFIITYNQTDLIQCKQSKRKFLNHKNIRKLNLRCI